MTKGKFIKFCGDVKFEDFYRISVSALRATGINMMATEDSPKSDRKRKFFQLYHKIFLFNFILGLTSFALSLWNHLYEHKLFIKILTSFLTGYFNFYKAILITREEKSIKQVIRDLRKYFPIFADDQEKYKVKRHFRIIRNMQIVYFALYALLIILNFFKTIITCFLTGNRSLIGEFWVPFELNSNIKYTVYVFWACCSSFAIVLCGFGTDFILFTTIILLNMEFYVLKGDFQHAIDKNENLKLLVEKHERLIQIINNLHSIFENYLFYYISQSSVVISLMCFQLAVTGDFAFFIPYLFAKINQIWLLCYFGQKLYDSSSSISDGIFNSNWYAMEDIKIKKNLILIIQRSQKAKILKAQGLDVITFNSFRVVR